MPYKNKEDHNAHNRAYRAKRKAAGRPLASGPRTKNPARQETFSRLKFLAWDGEGITPEGETRNNYVMLCNSNGAALESADLSKEPGRVFDFLLEHGSARNTKNVIFSGSYDFTHWILGLPAKNIKELYQEEHTYWSSYHIKYTRKKCFTVTTGTKEKKNYRACTVWDVFGFFQDSFIGVINKWHNDAEPLWESDAQKETISKNKRLRSDFNAEQYGEIKRYCFEECKLLSKLITRLRDLLQVDPDNPGNKKPWIPLRRWDGAGAVAAAIYRKVGMKAHVGSSVEKRMIHQSPVKAPDYHYRNKQEQQAIEYALKSAFFGGRIECFQKGRANCKGWDIDLKSAYPAMMPELPSFSVGGRWHKQTAFDPKSFGVWRVTWNCHPKYQYDEHTIYPFPFRTPKGEVIFPAKGNGWYHTKEVIAALADTRNDIKISCGWIWEPATDEKPFAFVVDYFNQREKLKAIGHAAEKILKLGLNSLYGKTAQTLASEFESVTEHNDELVEEFGAEILGEWNCDKIFSKVSGNFNMYWAGAITAGCRAELYTEAIKHESDIVMIQTDGLFGVGEPPLYDKTGLLGSWEIETYADCIAVQAGVYWLGQIVDGKMVWKVSKTRGFNQKDVLPDTVLAGWKRGDEVIKYESAPRFRTLGSCENSKTGYGHLACWETQQREVDLYIDSKRAVYLSSGKKREKLWERLYPAIPNFLQTHFTTEMSKPYNPKWEDENEEVKYLNNTIPLEEGDDYEVDEHTMKMREKLAIARKGVKEAV